MSITFLFRSSRIAAVDLCFLPSTTLSTQAGLQIKGKAKAAGSAPAA
jgi:hypothetical protein